MGQEQLDPTIQSKINDLVLAGNFEEAQALLKKNQASAQEVAAVLGGPRSAEATRLAEQSQGKIVLRVNAKGEGVVDFPELSIKGMGRLSVAGPTDFSDPEKALVQGGYQEGGVPGISYMTGKRAMQEATTQGKKLLSADSATAKIEALFATLGTNGAEQTKALQALFGTDFSGFWHPLYETWLHVGSTSFVGASEVDTLGDVRAIRFDASRANQIFDSQGSPKAFFAFEEC